MDTNRLFLFAGGPPSQHKEAVIAYIERCDFGSGGKADITVRGVERTVIQQVRASMLGHCTARRRVFMHGPRIASAISCVLCAYTSDESKHRLCIYHSQ